MPDAVTHFAQLAAYRLDRIVELERQLADAPPAELVERQQQRIAELEAKVRALASESPAPSQEIAAQQQQEIERLTAERDHEKARADFEENRIVALCEQVGAEDLELAADKFSRLIAERDALQQRMEQTQRLALEAAVTLREVSFSAAITVKDSDRLEIISDRLRKMAKSATPPEADAATSAGTGVAEQEADVNKPEETKR